MTTRYFFIVGHQRSRTAWLSNLLTDGKAFCYHDACRAMRNPPRLEEVVNNQLVQADEIGDSDNGLAIFPTALDWFYEQDEDLPIAIIRRNPDDVLRSLKRLHYGRVTEQQLKRSIDVSEVGLERIAHEGPNVMEYPFDELNDLDVLADMAQHLLGREIDLQRAAYLRTLNVQYQEPWYSANFSASFQAYVKNLIGSV